MGRMMVRVIGTVAAMALAAAVGWFGVVNLVEPRSSGRRASVTGTEEVPAAAVSEDVPAATMAPPARLASEPGPAAGADAKDTPERRGGTDPSEEPDADRGGGRSGKRSDQATP